VRGGDKGREKNTDERADERERSDSYENECAGKRMLRYGLKSSNVTLSGIFGHGRVQVPVCIANLSANLHIHHEAHMKQQFSQMKVEGGKGKDNKGDDYVDWTAPIF
jgi:hypothetical protein